MPEDQHEQNSKEYRDYLRAQGDEEERRQRYDYHIGARRTPLSNNVLLMLGELLPPKTEGFLHINEDMSCSNVDMIDKFKVQNLSSQIAFFQLFNLKKSLYLAWNDMATILNLDKSVNGWWGDLFTKTVTEKSEQFKDVTPKKTGWLPFGKREGGKV